MLMRAKANPQATKSSLDKFKFNFDSTQTERSTYINTDSYITTEEISTIDNRDLHWNPSSVNARRASTTSRGSGIPQVVVHGIEFQFIGSILYILTTFTSGAPVRRCNQLNTRVAVSNLHHLTKMLCRCMCHQNSCLI